MKYWFVLYKDGTSAAFQAKSFEYNEKMDKFVFVDESDFVFITDVYPVKAFHTMTKEDFERHTSGFSTVDWQQTFETVDDE